MQCVVASLAVALMAVSGSCDPAGPATDAGPGQPDARISPMPDASIDARPIPPDVSEVVPGGGRMSGGAYEMEAQLGHWFSQQPFSAGNVTGEGAAAVKP